MILKLIFGSIAVPCLLLGGSVCAFAEEPDGDEIVKLCYYKNQGKDQKTRLTFTVTNDEGLVTKSRTFIRFWKDYRGQGDLISKLMLFTEAPPEYANSNYLRINFTLTSGKPPEQWIYAPGLQTVRLMAVREQTNLDWGFIAEDLNVRQLDEDSHRLIDSHTDDGATVYDVESIPNLKNSAYGKMVSKYVKTETWGDCSLRSTEYFDKSGRLIKTGTFSWRQIEDAWVLMRADIEIEPKPDPEALDSEQNNKKVVMTYETTAAEVNVGLTDSQFSQRYLKRTIR